MASDRPRRSGADYTRPPDFRKRKMAPKRKATSIDAADDPSRKKRGKQAATEQLEDLIEKPEEEEESRERLQSAEDHPTETGTTGHKTQAGQRPRPDPPTLPARQDPTPAAGSPSVINGADTQDAGQEIELEATGNLLEELQEKHVSVHLLRYVDWVLDQNNFRHIDLTLREQVLRHLIKVHGTGNDWRSAAPFLMYADGRLTFDQRPLREEDFDFEWDRLRQALCQARILAENLKEFDALRMRTLRQKLLFLPPNWEGDQQPPDEYVQKTLKDEYIKRARDFLRPDWDSEFGRGDNPMMDEAANRAYAGIFSDSESKILPYSVSEYRWDRKWREARNAVHARELDANEEGSFEDMFGVADEEFLQYGDFIEPTEFTASLDSVQFLDDLRKHVWKQVDANFHDAWRTSIEHVRTHGEYQVLSDEYHKMQSVPSQMRRRPTGRLWHPSRIPTALEQAHRLSPGIDRSSLVGHWNFQQVLGQGGRGVASLWVKLDNVARIVDRIVVKDSDLCVKGNDLWDDPRLWYGNIARRIPKEWEVNRRLKECKDSDHIVHTENTRAIYEIPKIHRLYFEFCVHGTLENVIANHKDLSRRRRIAQDGRNLPFLVPTRALWAIFEALASAACIMRYGALPDNDQPQPAPAHQPIIHIDIKPDNVFLTIPDKDLWSGIPVVKLADYGLARFENDLGAEWGDGEGTQGYQAPEQCYYQSTSEWYHTHRMSSKSDVWAIGRVMLSLMNLLESRSGQDEEIAVLNFDSTADVPVDFADAERRYPADLCRLVKACLQKMPDNRISVAELWTQIRLRVASFEGLRGLPLKMRKGENDELLYYQPDKYALWSRII